MDFVLNLKHSRQAMHEDSPEAPSIVTIAVRIHLLLQITPEEDADDAEKRKIVRRRRKRRGRRISRASQ
jgi:hypothetical protein